MGPVRSLYEEEGELERVVAGGGGGRRDEAGEGGSLLNLRPVHVSDLGELAERKRRGFLFCLSCSGVCLFACLLFCL